MTQTLTINARNGVDTPTLFATLDAVKAQFLLNDEDANRFGYYLVSFISALNGF